jgi:hypothetical protein
MPMQSAMCGTSTILDKRLDQHIAGVMRGSGIEWDFGRKRGLGSYLRALDGASALPNVPQSGTLTLLGGA